LLLIDKALCLSAAKKEEYESFLTFRQLLFSRSTILMRPQLLDFAIQICREANYSKPSAILARHIGEALDDKTDPLGSKTTKFR
jgi:hypothetical protein